MNNTVSLCLKITNWCNMRCAHCCECSSPNVAPKIMPIDKFQKYVYEFADSSYEKSAHITISGGEATAPYFFNQSNYMSDALNTIFDVGGIPTIKTNATWGTDNVMRQIILQDLAFHAYKNNTVITLDISIDEFHNNIAGAGMVIANVIKNQHLAPAIRIALVGFASHASFSQMIRLGRELGTHDIEMISNGNDEMIALHGVMGFKIFTDFHCDVHNIGRARINKLGKINITGTPDANNNSCLQLDNYDIATLNYKWREKIANRPIGDVIKKLLSKSHNK